MLKKSLLAVFFLAVCFAMSLTIIASDKKEEAKKGDEKECKMEKISVDELKKAMEEKKVTIVDANGTESFAKGHIAGALDAKAEGFDAKLPADKASLIVVYCGGEKCSGNKDVCGKIGKLGFTNLKCLTKGLKGWTEAGGVLEK